jgi:hypothetical protein
VPAAELHAGRPGELAQRRHDRLVLDLDAAFHLAVDEARADVEALAVEVELVVRVVAPPEPVANGLDAARLHAPLALRQDLVLREIDAPALGCGFRAGAIEACKTLE